MQERISYAYRDWSKLGCFRDFSLITICEAVIQARVLVEEGHL